MVVSSVRRPRGLPSLTQGALQLALVHVRTATDVAPLGLLVQLVVRGPLRAPTRALSAALAGRLVLGGRPARGPGLTGTGALLVHGPRRDLLGAPLALPAVARALLDVLVLAFPLRTGATWHDRHFLSGCGYLTGTP